MSDLSGTSAEHDAAVARLEREVSLLLRRARSVMRVLADQVQPGIDPPAYSALVAIARAAPLRLVDLAEEIGLDKSTMSRQVTDLLKLGLVQRRPDPEDGRAFLLELSDEGRSRLEAVSSRRHQIWLQRLDEWSTDEIASLADGLTRLAAAIVTPTGGHSAAPGDRPPP